MNMEEKRNNSVINQEKISVPISHTRGRPRVFDIDKALTVALKIFWEKGYTQTTMTDICQALGIKPTSFYYAFGSKQELFLKTLNYYIETYWSDITNSFFSEFDIHDAVKKLFKSAIQVYMNPDLPKGCFMDISTIGLSDDEESIKEALLELQIDGKNNIRKRLLMAITAGQLPYDSDIPAITNAIYIYLKGISAVARENVCQAELNQIASFGVLLLHHRR